jgi:hypothetical protein
VTLSLVVEEARGTGTGSATESTGARTGGTCRGAAGASSSGALLSPLRKGTRPMGTPAGAPTLGREMSSHPRSAQGPLWPQTRLQAVVPVAGRTAKG